MAHAALLYVSDYDRNAVEIRTYPAGSVAGRLTGIDEPEGECADEHGNVWITSDLPTQLVEYPHGGTDRMATLPDTGGYPVGCAVDPATGNLAVTNFSTDGWEAGSGTIAVFKGAKGRAQLYPSSLNFPFFCAYDASGNLFADGLNGYGHFQLAELVKGASAFTSIALSGTIYYPGAVAWVGKYLAIGDQLYQDKTASAIYQVSISGSQATIEGTAPLLGAQDVLQFWIDRGRVVGPDVEGGDVGFWTYPKGGEATKTLTDFREPIGAVVSRAQ